MSEFKINEIKKNHYGFNHERFCNYKKGDKKLKKLNLYRFNKEYKDVLCYAIPYKKDDEMKFFEIRIRKHKKHFAIYGDSHENGPVLRIPLKAIKILYKKIKRLEWIQWANL